MARFLIAFVIICVLGAAGYWYWTTTPQYSMIKLSEAVRKHDGLAFRSYFDVDNVSSHAVDDLLSEGVREVGGAGLLQRIVGMTIARLFKPELASSLSKKIIDYVEKKPESNTEESSHSQHEEARSTVEAQSQNGFGRAVQGFVSKLVEAIKPPSLKEVLQEIGLTKQNYRGLTDFQVSGSLCHVGLKFQPPGKNEIIVQLELENVDNHWKVVRFSNLDSIARSIY